MTLRTMPAAAAVRPALVVAAAVTMFVAASATSASLRSDPEMSAVKMLHRSHPHHLRGCQPRPPPPPAHANLSHDDIPHEREGRRDQVPPRSVYVAFDVAFDELQCSSSDEDEEVDRELEARKDFADVLYRLRRQVEAPEENNTKLKWVPWATLLTHEFWGGQTAWHSVVASGDVKLLRGMVQAIPAEDTARLIARRNKAGETPLHKAAESNNLTMVGILLDHGAGRVVNVDDFAAGMTPLHYAARR